MLRFNYIEMRNFLSFGNVTQRVELNGAPLTLILGMNNDATNNESEEETRNGVGKSSVIQALNFAIYGKAVANKIKVNNLVNKTNKRHCEVTLSFEKDGTNYTITRKRSPTDLVFIVEDTNYDELIKDEAQGDNRDSQQAITDIVGMSQDLFTQIVTITTSVDSFLDLAAGKQRQLIEELLTITQLSEKADKLKEMLKQVKEAISREQFRVETVEASNGKILISIKQLEQQAADFNTKQRNRTAEIDTTLTALQSVDIEQEKLNQTEKQRIIAHNEKANQLIAQYKQAQLRDQAWQRTHTDKISSITKDIETYESIDIVAEMEAQESLAVWNQLNNIFETNQCERLRLDRDDVALSKRAMKHNTEVKRLTDQLAHALEATCPTCSGPLSDDNHTHIVDELNSRITSEESAMTLIMSEIAEIGTKLASIEQFELPEKPLVRYQNINDAYKHQTSVDALKTLIETLQAEVSPHDAQVLEIEGLLVETIVDNVVTVYANAAQVYQHESAIEQLLDEGLKLEASTNPYDQQIDTLKNSSLQDITYDELNRLRKMQEHQEFLIKLLTDKNSYVRKKIIDQNLGFLNQRLQLYMEKSSSSHSVTFMNDLSVDITMMGEEYDFDNLSRGEKNRVIIALSMAFRDMFESLNFGINTLMIDEILDNGLDKAGTNACYKMLNDLSNQRGKNCFLITHREELQSRCENILMVVKENGFTTVEQNEE